MVTFKNSLTNIWISLIQTNAGYLVNISYLFLCYFGHSMAWAEQPSLCEEQVSDADEAAKAVCYDECMCVTWRLSGIDPVLTALFVAEQLMILEPQRDLSLSTVNWITAMDHIPAQEKQFNIHPVVHPSSKTCTYTHTLTCSLPHKSLLW